MENSNVGYEQGESCNRDGCVGIIEEHYRTESCSCHINPPCSSCVESRAYCPVCDWDGKEEQEEKEHIASEKWRNMTKSNSVTEPVFVDDGKRYNVVKYFDTHPEYKIGSNLNLQEAKRVQLAHIKQESAYVTFEIREIETLRL